jgi:hypothetical protein
LFLVLPGTPPAVDEELDPVARSLRRGLMERTEQSRIEVGHGRVRVIEDRHAVRDLTISDAKRTVTVALRSAGKVALRLAGKVAGTVAAETVVWAVGGRLRDDGCCCRRRARQRTVTEDTHKRRDDDQDSEDRRSRTAACSRCWLAVAHAVQSRQRCVASTYAVFGTPTICAGS